HFGNETVAEYTNSSGEEPDAVVVEEDSDVCQEVRSVLVDITERLQMYNVRSRKGTVPPVADGFTWDGDVGRKTVSRLPHDDRVPAETDYSRSSHWEGDGLCSKRIVRRVGYSHRQR